MVHLKALADSALYRRIANSSLKALVDKAAPEAAALLTRVANVMPLYTLHDERHILNVIGWMESLVGPNGIEQLSELECALSILAAYTHDLGMTLTPEERANISTDADYVRHRDRFTEETKLIERLLSQQDHHRAALIENHIITDYIRATHAGQPGKRMADRLREIAPRLEFGGVDLTFRLQLQDKSGTPFQPVDGIHARPGFFKHHGPEQELAVTLSWGEQDGIQFLRVDDNGAGMTLQTIERNQRSVA